MMVCWDRVAVAADVGYVGVAAVVVADVGRQEWTQLQLSSTPGFLIASEPPTDDPRPIAYFVD